MSATAHHRYACMQCPELCTLANHEAPEVSGNSSKVGPAWSTFTRGSHTQLHAPMQASSHRPEHAATRLLFQTAPVPRKPAGSPVLKKPAGSSGFYRSNYMNGL